MDRRTLLAVVIIMAVLLVDQVIWSRWTKSRQPANAPTAGAPASPGAPDSAALRAAIAESTRLGRPLPAPGEASSLASKFTGTVASEGSEPLIAARVAPGVWAAGGDVGGIATGGYASGLAAGLVLGRIAGASALEHG